MEKCPIEGCGRQFENQQTMIEHLRRRHPQHFQQSKPKLNKQLMENQNKIQQEISKLPKVNRIIQMSKQKKQIQFNRRSSSKNRKQLSTLISNQSKVSDIITQSRQLVQDSSKKIIKRPSLNKKQSSNQVKQQKLPSLTTNKILKKSKLQIIKSEMQKTITMNTQTNKQLIIKKSSQTHQQFYSTAPHFAKKLSNRQIRPSLKSGSKGKQSKNSSKQKVDENNLVRAQTLKQLKPQQQQQQKKKLGQRPMKRFLDLKKLSSSQLKTENPTERQKQQLSQSLYIQPKVKTGSQVDIKPALSFKPKNITNNNKNTYNSTSINQFSDQKMNISLQVDWQQKIVNLRNQTIKYLIVPKDCLVQYLYANNCKIQKIELNEIQTLTELSLTNNNLSNLCFLDYCQNYNLIHVYLDHNQINSLEGLPHHIRKASFSFNKIKDLDQTVKILYKCKELQQLDFSFNPIRKEPNYKLAIVAACRKLKKLDGMKITKFDKQLASEYRKLLDQQNQIIPLGNSSQKQQKWRPSTAVSIQYQQEMQPTQLTEKQLSSEIKKLEKIIKQTKEQFQIIKEENQILNEEVQQMKKVYQEKQVQNVDTLYKKLQSECQQLQMLNFLQYADEEELQALLIKKMAEYGVKAF